MILDWSEILARTDTSTHRYQQTHRCEKKNCWIYLMIALCLVLCPVGPTLIYDGELMHCYVCGSFQKGMVLHLFKFENFQPKRERFPNAN